MKHLLAVAFAACLLEARPELIFQGVAGPRHVYPGQTAYLTPVHTWIDASEFRVDPATGYVILPGHTFRQWQVVRVASPDGKLPNPLNAMKTYTVADVEEGRFRLVEFRGARKRIEFADAGSGTLWMGPKINHKTHVYIEPSFAAPLAGAALSCGCTDKAKRYFSYYGWTPVTFEIRTDASAAPAATTMKWTLSAEGAKPVTIEVPFGIRELKPVALGKPARYPPIPGKGKWESTMLRLAKKWCKPGERMGFGVDSQVWFYDGAWVFYQIAEYTGDPRWNECADNISSQFAAYVNRAKGGIAGYRIFVDGLKRGGRDDPETYRAAIEALALRSPFARKGGDNFDGGIRETAYLLEAQVMYEKTSGKQAPQRAKTVDLLLGMFDTLFHDDAPSLHQTFMNGLAMRALIRYYELAPDPRVPAAIKEALDWMWERSWSPKQNALLYSPYAYGPVCLSYCREPNTDLINLTAPAYAWFWSITGDETYRRRGDALFEHSLDNDISYSGKIFSQNYRWSFDFVRWREGKRPFQP